MPVITMESSPLATEQKRRLVSELTQVAANITGISERAFVVLLKENDRDNIGSGGKLLSEGER